MTRTRTTALAAAGLLALGLGAAFTAHGDGALSLEEYQTLWLDAYLEQMVDAFQRHDDNGDTRLTVEEFGDDYRNLVARMDA